MNAKEIKDCLPDTGEERILNMSYRIGEDYGVLAMLAKSEEGLILWEICREPVEEKMNIRRLAVKSKTNRESVRQRFYHTDKPFIRRLRIGEQEWSVSTASGTCIGEECNIQERVHLIYLISRGVRLGELEQEPLTCLRMNRYYFTEHELPAIGSPEYADDVRLTFSMQHIPVRVNKRMKFKAGKYKKPRVLKLDSEEEITVYIHGVRLYDIWENAEKEFQDVRCAGRFTEEEIVRMKEQYMASLPDICPKGSMIPLIDYECDRDYQMQFYDMEYLRRKPESKSSFMLMNFKADTEQGPMGFRRRICPLEAVESGYDGSFLVELFMYYRQIPERTVKCSPV